MAKPVVLIIRDGWGINPSGEEGAVADGNVTLLGKTPFHDHLYETFPMATASASGEDVGLPAGQMGNSEVGHLNLGAGRIVYQDLSRINLAIASGEIAENEVLNTAFSRAKGARLHFLGLVSDGGVHSHQDHLVALCDLAKGAGVEDLVVHAITDGRDTSPTGGADFLAECEEKLAGSGAKIATVVGRYYAMDRDRRWERTKIAWDAIVDGKGEVKECLPSEAVRACYDAGQTDEFLLPMIFMEPDSRRVRDGDVVIWFNFRADRARQISEAFLIDGFDGFETHEVPAVEYVTLTEYDARYHCPIVFPSVAIMDGLGETVSKAGLRQLRIAESEKYPHVTYFFNGGIEQPYPRQEIKEIPSPKVATYDLQPEMSAPRVTEELVSRLGDFDLVILNFANPDMVGHTGVVEAGIKAVEMIDHCVQAVVEKTLELGGSLLITADHGNCDQMRNPDGSPHTAHTTNLVHVIYVGADHAGVTMRDGILADIAPTLLVMLGVEKPEAMTGSSLIERK